MCIRDRIVTGLKKTQIKERKQIKKENRVAKNLLLLNPGNLAKEVYTYGYHFSWKTHLFVIGVCIAGMGVIGLLFQLKWELLVIVLIAMFLALPAFILDTYKKMYEQKRFADAATYMEQMLYACLLYTSHKKLLSRRVHLLRFGQHR